MEISNRVTPDNVEITVWKIETVEKDGEEHVVLESDDAGILGVTDNSEELEKKIQYIIRINPKQKDIITASSETACEGENVTVKVKAPDGYRVTGAYGDDGKTLKLQKDASGNYYVVVPRGGGVYLSAELEKTAEEQEAVSQDIGPREYATVTFRLNGGHTFTGNTNDIVKTVPVGTWLRLADAPSKEGTEFLFWYTEDESVHARNPYESFQVLRDVLFVAQWEGEAPVQEAESAPELEVSVVESPRTGEAEPALPVDIQIPGLDDGMEIKGTLVFELGGQTIELPVTMNIHLDQP